MGEGHVTAQCAATCPVYSKTDKLSFLSYTNVDETVSPSPAKENQKCKMQI